MDNSVECEADSNQNAIEIKGKKDLVKGTKNMALKNCTSNILQVKDSNNKSVDIPAG